MKNVSRLMFPITILLVSIIMGGFYYASEANKQRSIERQQIIKLQEDKRVEEAKNEQNKKEYISRRKLECYDIEQRERKNWNNVDGSFYDEINDTCKVRYTTNEYLGVDCDKKYKDIPSLQLQCELGIFTKTF